jgi:hypothetical protein
MQHRKQQIIQLKPAPKMADAFGLQRLFMDVDLVQQHKAELGHLDVGKSCIRFKKIDDFAAGGRQADIG